MVFCCCLLLPQRLCSAHVRITCHFWFFFSGTFIRRHCAYLPSIYLSLVLSALFWQFSHFSVKMCGNRCRASFTSAIHIALSFHARTTLCSQQPHTHIAYRHTHIPTMCERYRIIFLLFKLFVDVTSVFDFFLSPHNIMNINWLLVRTHSSDCAYYTDFQPISVCTFVFVCS